MTNANEQSQPENILDMRSIMISLPGVAHGRTEEDIDAIARETGEPKLGLTTDPDGSVETQLGDFQVNVDRNSISVTHQLAHDPVLAEPDILDTCRFVAAILDGAQDAVTIPVVQMDAIAAVAPELGRALESGVVELAATHGGKEIAVWHRLTPRHDAEPTGRFGLDYRYRAVTPVVVGRISAQETLEDAALTVMREMVRVANLDTVPVFGEGDIDYVLAPMDDPDYYDFAMSSFLESDYRTKQDVLDSAASVLVAGRLRVPNGLLPPTVAELKRLSEGYARLSAGHLDVPEELESRDLRSMVLLRQIKRSTWPSEGGEGGVG